MVAEMASVNEIDVNTISGIGDTDDNTDANVDTDTNTDTNSDTNTNTNTNADTTNTRNRRRTSKQQQSKRALRYRSDAELYEDLGGSDEYDKEVLYDDAQYFYDYSRSEYPDMTEYD